jgi:hypothetical protein
MCIVCVDLIKQNLTIPEAERNLGEMNSTFRREDSVEEFLHRHNLEKAIRDMDLETIGKELDNGEELENKKILPRW